MSAWVLTCLGLLLARGLGHCTKEPCSIHHNMHHIWVETVIKSLQLRRLNAAETQERHAAHMSSYRATASNTHATQCQPHHVSPGRYQDATGWPVNGLTVERSKLKEPSGSCCSSLPLPWPSSSWHPTCKWTSKKRTGI